MTTMRQHSRAEFDSENTAEHIQLGALQRIADAAEAMAKNHNDLIRDRDNYKRWYLEEKKTSDELRKSLSSTKGVVTRLRRQLAELQAAQAQPTTQGTDTGTDGSGEGGA